LRSRPERDALLNAGALSTGNTHVSMRAKLFASNAEREYGVVKVVVVDDSLLVQRSLGRLLTAVDGISVVGYAEDVAGATALIDATRPDVVVLDVDLRHQDRGMDVLHYVVRVHPGIKVIALSNFTWQAMREGFLLAGASAYFDKSMEFIQARDWITEHFTKA
jgi:DNA-binding NarL/FixJ family response regulator